MAKDEVNVKSNNQKGGITAGIINIKIPNKKRRKIIIGLIPVFMLALALLTYFGFTGDKMFGKKDKETKDVYNVESHNQQGGVTAGKIENLNILTDKESLGIRETDGLYQNSKKVGKVINFNANESSNTFTISEIQFDQPLRNVDTVWQPYEFQDYIIRINKIDRIVTMMPPGAVGVSGLIVEKRNK